MQNQFNVSEIKLSYEPKYRVSERPKIQHSQDAYLILKEHWDAGIMQFLEEFKIILLNRANRVLGVVDISLGGLVQVSVDVKVILAIALKAGATGIILSHNHPSGNLKPSAEDLRLTHKITDAAKLMDISVFDHLIMTSDGYYSYTDNGIMP